MSRTYHKNISIGLCHGDNRDYYKRRRRHFKKLFKQDFNSLLKHYAIEDVSNLVLNPKYPKRDTWNEPTDGRYLINKASLHTFKRKRWLLFDFFVDIAKRHLKPYTKRS